MEAIAAEHLYQWAVLVPQSIQFCKQKPRCYPWHLLFSYHHVLTYQQGILILLLKFLFSPFCSLHLFHHYPCSSHHDFFPGRQQSLPARPFPSILATSSSFSSLPATVWFSKCRLYSWPLPSLLWQPMQLFCLLLFVLRPVMCTRSSEIFSSFSHCLAFPGPSAWSAVFSAHLHSLHHTNFYYPSDVRPTSLF